MAFLREWFRAALWGDSVLAIAAKLVAAALVLLGVPAFHEKRIPFFVAFPWGWSTWQEPSAGVVSAAFLGIGYATYTAGVAWVRSRGPVLEVADTLTADTEVETFRLQVRNRGDGILTPSASFLWIERDEVPDHEAWMPLEVRWFPDGNPPRLSSGEAANLQICQFQERATPLEVAVFIGRGPVAHVRLRPVQREFSVVSFCVRVGVPGTRRHMDRAFRLEFDPTMPLRFRPVRIRERESSRT